MRYISFSMFLQTKGRLKPNMNQQEHNASTNYTQSDSVLLKVAIFALILIGLYVLYTTALPRLVVTEESYGEYYWPRARLLFPHVIFGLLATLIGPFQFVRKIRNKHLKLHRRMGQIYLICVLIAAGFAIYLALSSAVTRMYTIGLCVVASLWIISALRAYHLVRNRRIKRHKQWMARNYVITLFFITFMFIFDLLEALGVGTHDGNLTILAWMAWIVPLAVTEVVLRTRQGNH